MMKWWHRLIPTNGNWGGPHYAGGKRFDFYFEVNWNALALTRLDAACKIHDLDYRDGKSRLEADRQLVRNAYFSAPENVYEIFYRFGILGFFGARVALCDLLGIEY